MGSLIELKAGGGSRSAKAVSKLVGKGKAKGQKVVDISLKHKKKEWTLTAKQRENLVLTYRLKARKLARSILRKWHSRMDLHEVDSVVDLSLCEAVKRFNPQMGASFMTFLFYHLRGNLIRAVTTAASAHFIPLGEVDNYYSQQENPEGAESQPARAVNAIEIAEALCGNDYPLPDELLFKRELIDLSQKACDKLDDLAREVISRIYLQGQQLIDIANSLGYSRCHISRVKKKALETLYQDLSELMGVPAEASRPNFDDDEEMQTSEDKADRRQIFRRRPRSKKAQLCQEEKLAVGAH